jgi:murein DD-endopeptidase MepM/ murein hydrolase activator NlpD
MRRFAPALIALALLLGATNAHAQKTTPEETWKSACQDVKLAGHLLRQTFDVPELAQQLSVYFDVKLREAIAAADKMFASIGTLAPDVHTPDLSALTAEPVKGVESSGYGWREDPIDGGKRFHKGTDYKADRGTPVYAAGAGVVTIAGTQNGYGKVIYIDHGGGLVTRYAHLSHIDVSKGDLVDADTFIGQVGATGRATGPHLHFEIRLDGRAVDPVLGMDVAEMQRTQPAALVRLAAMALLPEAQKQKVDRHGPPKKANRPERAGRGKRDIPTS